jgi:hypothetical protein
MIYESPLSRAPFAAALPTSAAPSRWWHSPFATFGGDQQPQEDVVLRPRLAMPAFWLGDPAATFSGGVMQLRGFAAALECNVPEIARGREQGAAANLGFSS